MTAAARKQLERALDLSDDGRLAIASALLENVGGSRDSKWDAEWMKEQDRHYAAARASGPPHAESSDADLSAPCRAMMRSIRLLPEAEAEFAEAAGNVEARRECLAVSFVESIHQTIAKILDAPIAGALDRTDQPFRKWLVRRFPFVVIYKVVSAIEMTAIAHTSRRPGYWLGLARS